MQQWQTKAHAKRDKGMILMTLSAWSQEHQDFYNEHTKSLSSHCWHIHWYTCQRTVSQTSNSTYFYCDPLDVDFELPSSAPETPLNGFLNKFRLPGSTCESTPLQDPLEHFLPNPCNHHWYGSKINECHHIDTILLPPIESYHASAPKNKY